MIEQAAGLDDDEQEGEGEHTENADENIDNDLTVWRQVCRNIGHKKEINI